MPVVIDPQFEDITFEDQPEYVFGDLGDTPFDRLFGDNYEDVESVMSESELREAAEQIAEEGGSEEFVTRVFSQGREGSCVANASGQGHEVSQAVTYGKDNVIHLSAISLYKQIGRSPNSGATISGGFRGLSEIGILPLDNDENRAKFGDQVMPNTGWSTRYPDGWEETAKHFRLQEANVIRSLDGLLTSLCRQQPVIVGRSGHSICYLTPIWENGWKVLYANSWGKWGQGAGDFEYGFGIDTIGKIQSSARWAYSIRSVTARQEW
jgi:hypothetical protein